MSLRVLVIDDTVLFRRVVSDALGSLPDVAVIGTASTGKTALARMAELTPDLVTLDIEMPDMSGLEVLAEMKRRGLTAGAVIVSAMSIKGGQLTLRALELGAFDFITKPTGGSAEQNRQAISTELAPIIKAFAQRHEIKSILRGQPPLPRVASTPARATDGLAGVAQRMGQVAAKVRPEMLLIGVSTGGPVALAEVIPKLPADLNVPVLIVQHMPPTFTRCLAESLDAKSAIRVREAADNERLLPGVAYIAPGGRQMKVVPGLDGARFVRITDDPPENNCRPAVDYLFRSVAHGFPGKALAVIMTGMGSDGTLGLRLLKRTGCGTLAQDEASCVVFGMPGEAIKAGVVDVVAPLGELAGRITRMIRGY